VIATTIASAFIASFLGSFVEVVEAFTIVLAVGITQGWRPALFGSAMALAVLVALVVLLGPLLSLIPIDLIQLLVGTLLVLFGLRWLRKAILRASGFIALHDEAKAFGAEVDSLTRQAADRRADMLAATVAFKAVLLEGVEVVFIVIATGAGNGMIGYASAGAALACLLVAGAGFLLHKPLSTVPENSLKFVVGLLLSAFGVFWIGEGLGADWPGADLSLLGILAVLAIFSILAVRTLRRLGNSAVSP
jgi:uncharacterized membrane protein